MDVQAEIVRGLKLADSSDCLHRIREELSRGVSALVQLVKGDAIPSASGMSRGANLMPAFDGHQHLADVNKKDGILQSLVDKMTTVDNWTPVRSVNVNAIVYSERSFVGFEGEAIAYIGGAMDGKSVVLTFKTQSDSVLKF